MQMLLCEPPPSSVTPLAYVGGKSVLWNLLQQLIPPGTTQAASPFIGGGGLEVKMAASGIQVYASDILEPLANFWQYFIKDAEKLCKFAQGVFPIGDEEAKQLYPQNGEDWTNAGFNKLPDFEKAAYFWMLNKQTFMSYTLRSPKIVKTGTRKEYFSDPKMVNWRNSNLQVECMDWRDALALHHDKFLYLDPPYVEKEHFYGIKGEKPTFDHYALRDALNQHGAPWVMSYGYHQLVLDLYANHIVVEPKWQYSMSHGNNKTGNELLIISGIDINRIAKIVGKSNIINRGIH